MEHHEKAHEEEVTSQKIIIDFTFTIIIFCYSFLPNLFELLYLGSSNRHLHHFVVRSFATKFSLRLFCAWAKLVNLFPWRDGTNVEISIFLWRHQDLIYNHLNRSIEIFLLFFRFFSQLWSEIAEHSGRQKCFFIEKRDEIKSVHKKCLSRIRIQQSSRSVAFHNV